MPRQKKISDLVNLVAWLGPFAILLAYALASFGVIEARSFIFQGLSLGGGLILAYIALRRRDYQPATLNIILSVIALITILSLVIEEL